MKYSFIPFLALLLWSCSEKKQETSDNEAQEDTVSQLKFEYEYIGKAVEKKNTHVWGSSPVRGKDGKVHLYVAEWPMPEDSNERFTGWFKHCQVGHYVGDNPEGPFEFIKIAIEDQDGVFNAPHNPTVQFIDGKYILNFIVNEDNHKSKQRIIMYVADDLDDNWRPAEGAEKDGTVLRLPTDSSYWNVTATNGVSNPSLMKFKDKYLLYYKSVIPDPTDPKNNGLRNFGYSVAISDKLEGPYEMIKERITDDELQLEDAYAFTMNGKVHLLSRDFRATFGTRGGGLLWTSEDGLKFTKETTIRAFEGLDEYVSKERLEKNFEYRGTKEGHLERPQMLIENGIPQYLYVATGINDSSNYGSCSHVFKLKILK